MRARTYSEAVTDPALPSFSVATRPATLPARIGATAEDSAVWARGDEVLVASGVALRLDFSGPDRIRRAAAAWQQLLASAYVEDAIGVDGSGLIGFGTFAFADDSAATSTLIVPRQVRGRRHGISFVTEIAGGPAVVGDGPPRVPSATAAAMDEQRYRIAVADAVRRIRRGDLQKVVLARDLVAAPPPGFDLTAALRLLRRRYREAWTFAVDGFFGASPETLIATDGISVTARVLAGTASREDDPVADDAARAMLEASAKNRVEHSLAVDSLVVALAPSVRDLVVHRRFALELPNVWHLATDIAARLVTDGAALDLVAVLHPTAAVAGVPRGVAVDAIAELEPFDRGRYAGPVGWVGAHGAGEWAIGLRGAQVGPDGTVRAFAGAGIVADSDPATEYMETGWKFAPVREALGGGVDDLMPGAAPRPVPDRASA